MSHIAWLHAIPRPRQLGGGRTAQRSGDDARRPRAQRLPEDDPRLEPEPAEDLQHLLDWLWDVGPAVGGGMGPAPVDYRDIAAWAALTHTDPTPWEARMLRHLSRHYLAALSAAEDPAAQPPQTADAVQPAAQQRAQARAVFDAFGALRKR